MNEDCGNLAPCVWEALVQSAPMEWWVFTGALLGIVAVSWATVWVLYHRFITRMRSDIDNNRAEHKNDNRTVFERVNQVEETMLQRMDESNRELREELREQSRETNERLSRMLEHLANIDQHTDRRIQTPTNARRNRRAEDGR